MTWTIITQWQVELCEASLSQRQKQWLTGPSSLEAIHGLMFISSASPSSHLLLSILPSVRLSILYSLNARCSYMHDAHVHYIYHHQPSCRIDSFSSRNATYKSWNYKFLPQHKCADERAGRQINVDKRCDEIYWKIIFHDNSWVDALRRLSQKKRQNLVMFYGLHMIKARIGEFVFVPDQIWIIPFHFDCIFILINWLGIARGLWGPIVSEWYFA